MRLTDLNPQFVGAGGEGISNADGSPVPPREGVGLLFDCPCGNPNDRAFVYFSNPLDGGPARNDGGPVWQRAGETFDTLTLTPSIQRKISCTWHGYITNGEIITV